MPQLEAIAGPAVAPTTPPAMRPTGPATSKPDVAPRAPSTVLSGVQAVRAAPMATRAAMREMLFMITPVLIRATERGGGEALGGERVEFMAPRTGKGSRAARPSNWTRWRRSALIFGVRPRFRAGGQ
jgi:hypothetical protein